MLDLEQLIKADLFRPFQQKVTIIVEKFFIVLLDLYHLFF